MSGSLISSTQSYLGEKKSTAYVIELVILGNESQEHIDYAMPMRVMGYDYSAYKKQFDSNAMKYKDADGMGEDEYLSRMKRTDRFLPVITVTVYYGRKPWDGATSLHGMLDIPEELKRHVNDHRMLLVEARKNNLVLHDMNNVDLFNRPLQSPGDPAGRQPPCGRDPEQGNRIYEGTPGG